MIEKGSVEESLDRHFQAVHQRISEIVSELAIISGRISRVETRLGAVDEKISEGLGRVESAIILLADSLPGSVPGQESHVVKELRGGFGT